MERPRNWLEDPLGADSEGKFSEFGEGWEYKEFHIK